MKTPSPLDGSGSGCRFPGAAPDSPVPPDALAVFPKEIAEGPYSVFFSGGRARFGYRSPAEAVDFVAARAGRTGRAGYIYLYFSDVDELAHRYGARHGRTRHALRTLDEALGRLARSAGRGTRLVVTGHHGMLDFACASTICSFPVWGWWTSCRVRHPGTLARCSSRSAWERRRPLVNVSWTSTAMCFCCCAREAVQLKLFGPAAVAPQVLARLGQFVAISLGPDIMEFGPVRGADRPVVVSHHSGLTLEEMMVPLVVA